MTMRINGSNAPVRSAMLILGITCLLCAFLSGCTGQSPAEVATSPTPAASAKNMPPEAAAMANAAQEQGAKQQKMMDEMNKARKAAEGKQP
jgi:hypothetical protein